VTLTDIAKVAGVSKMTVSLALRADSSISAAMQQKIKQIAAELDYTPNHMAKGLIHGKSYNLTIMIGGFLHDDYQHQFVKGVIPYALKRGYIVSMVPLERDLELERAMIEKFTRMQTEGFLIFHCGEPSTYAALQKQGVPFVLYTKYFETLDSDYVVCDDYNGAYAMTEYLIDLGHKDIAFVYDSYLEQSSEVKERRMGYIQALRDRELPYKENNLISFNLFSSNEFVASEILENNQTFIDILTGPNRPTALFACNDILASFIYIAVKRLGLTIPDDISVVGYEGVYLGSVIDPPLTTVATPIQEMGRKACQVLLDKIEGILPQSEYVKIRLKPELVIRESAAALTDSSRNNSK